MALTLGKLAISFSAFEPRKRDRDVLAGWGAGGWIVQSFQVTLWCH